jgi:omega-6 fatty acid desaturase (delta-12 desaturase)
MTFTTQVLAEYRSGSDAFQLAKDLAVFRGSDWTRSVFELAVTLSAFMALWFVTWWSLDYGYWLTLLIALPAGAFLVRLFMIQHDCGHGAFFRLRRTNDWLGRILGVLTLTPYDCWKRSHAIHHASSGNLDQRGIGDITTLTVSEYLALPWLSRMRYRLYRNPFVMFGLGPAYLFIVEHRLPVGHMREGWRPWTSVMVTNAAIVAFFGGMAWLVGPVHLVSVQIPITGHPHHV